MSLHFPDPPRRSGSIALLTFFRNFLSLLSELFLSLMFLLQETLEVLECTVAQALEKINPEERDELKVSGKNVVKNLVAFRGARCHALGNLVAG